MQPPAMIDSPLWHRVADLVPRLRPTVRVRHRGEGEAARHLLADTLTGRHHLLDEAAWAFVGRFDGRRSIGELWQWLGENGRQPPTQHEIVEWLSRLDAAGLLQCDRLPDLAGLLRGQEREERRHRQARINPLSWRLPLGDPGRWLVRLDPLGRLLAHPLLLLAALLLVLLGAAQALLEGPALLADVRQRLASPVFLASVWAVYPLMKALHELGHALAVRHFGAEVRHVGIAVIYLLPAPYVDASAASGLARRRERAAVALAGIAIELVLAALGVLAWSVLQPGPVRDLALTLALVGVGSTLLANANPLVRMDGYHVLADLLDLPNLASRSRSAWLEALRSALLRQLRPQRARPGRAQRLALALHAPLAWLFGVGVAVSVVLWLAPVSAMLALLVAALSGWTLLLRPLLQLMRWLAGAPELGGRRLRVALQLLLPGATLLAVLLWLPLPHATVAEAVAWMPEEALVRAPADGEIVAVQAADRQRVEFGAPLLRLHSPALQVERAEVHAQRIALEIEALQQQIRHPAGAARAEARAQALQQQEDELSRRLAQLDSASRRAGQLRWIAPERLVAGRIVSRGEVLGHVLAGDRLIARVAVPGERVADLMRGVQAVEVLALEAPARPQAGRWDGVLPQTALRLPVRALGSSGGGAIEVDPADAEGLRTLAPVAVIDVGVPALAADRLGGRLKVRFDHGPRPLGGRLLEALQRLVLGRFGEAVDVPAGG